jgi:hypothetical protein
VELYNNPPTFDATLPPVLLLLNEFGNLGNLTQIMIERTAPILGVEHLIAEALKFSRRALCGCRAVRRAVN